MISRRAVLRCGAAGLALTIGATTRAAAETRHLVPDYRPSQPTGWPMTPGKSIGTTLGGHVPSVDFTHGSTPYQVNVLPLTYADVPTATFQDVLAGTFGDHYAYRYQGGFAGHDEFHVQSYGVFAQGGTEADPRPGSAAVCTPCTGRTAATHLPGTHWGGFRS